jgi:hypothetical protein
MKTGLDYVHISLSTRETSTFLQWCRTPGANLTTESYNASVVKINNAAGSLVRSGNHFFSFFNKKALTYYNAGVVVLKSKVVGLGPDKKKQNATYVGPMQCWLQVQ